MLVVLVRSLEEPLHLAATAPVGTIVHDAIRLRHYIVVVEVRREVTVVSLLGDACRAVQTEPHPLGTLSPFPRASRPVGEVQRVVEAAESHGTLENAELDIGDASLKVVKFFFGAIVLGPMNSAYAIVVMSAAVLRGREI